MLKPCKFTPTYVFKSPKGQTLIEMMIVVVVMGILATAAMYFINPSKDAKGTKCTSILSQIYTAQKMASGIYMWSSAGDIDDTKIVSKLSNKTPGTSPLICPLNGTYTWGSSAGWNSTDGEIKKPRCSYGPDGSKAGDIDNNSYPSSQHNVCNDASE